jgi:hypothetical protein
VHATHVYDELQTCPPLQLAPGQHSPDLHEPLQHTLSGPSVTTHSALVLHGWQAFWMQASELGQSLDWQQFPSTQDPPQHIPPGHWELLAQEVGCAGAGRDSESWATGCEGDREGAQPSTSRSHAARARLQCDEGILSSHPALTRIESGTKARRFAPTNRCSLREVESNHDGLSVGADGYGEHVGLSSSQWNHLGLDGVDADSLRAEAPGQASERAVGCL